MPTVFSKEIEQPPDNSNSSKMSSNNKVKKNSVGNQHKFAQQNHSKKNKSCAPEEGFIQSEFYQDLVIQQDIEKLSSCCPRGTRFGFGCLLSLFRSDKEGFSADTFQEEYSKCSKQAAQNSVLGTFFFFGIRDIVLDIWKYEFLVLGTLSLILLGTMSLIPKIFSGIYIQIRIDWNQFPAGKRIDSD